MTQAKPPSIQKNSKNITVLFRYDDYSSVSATEVEQWLMGTFQKFQICCLFAVIPDVSSQMGDMELNQSGHLSQIKIDILAEAAKNGVVDIALHGRSHKRLNPSDQRANEFSGIPYEDQKDRLADGKQLLETWLGEQATIFAPPWNTYDANTLTALDTLDFTCISAGIHTWSLNPKAKLQYLPTTCSILNLRDAVERVRQRNYRDVVIVVAMHDYDFVDAPEVKTDFAKSLQWLVNQPDVQTNSFHKILTSQTDLGFARYRNNTQIRKYMKQSPQVIRQRYPHGIYLNTKQAYLVQRLNWLLLAAFYVAIFLLSLLITTLGLQFFQLFRGGAMLIGVLSSLAFLTLLLYEYWRRRLATHYTRLVAIFLLLGVSLGIWIR